MKIKSFIVLTILFLGTIIIAHAQDTTHLEIKSLQPNSSTKEVPIDHINIKIAFNEEVTRYHQYPIKLYNYEKDSLIDLFIVYGSSFDPDLEKEVRFSSKADFLTLNTISL